MSFIDYQKAFDGVRKDEIITQRVKDRRIGSTKDQKLILGINSSNESLWENHLIVKYKEKDVLLSPGFLKKSLQQNNYARPEGYPWIEGGGYNENNSTRCWPVLTTEKKEDLEQYVLCHDLFSLYTQTVIQNLKGYPKNITGRLIVNIVMTLH